MAAPIMHTVEDAIILCGVNDTTSFNGDTKAERIADDVFDDDFQSCMDKTIKELDEDLKSYSALTIGNGQIRLTPGNKRNIRGLMQWCRDKIRVGSNPSLTPFPIIEVPNLIRRYKTHEAFVKMSTTMIDTAKPIHLKQDKTEWDDWRPTFENFLRAIPGRNGVPLLYVIRENDTAVLDVNADMLQDYINRAPLIGDVFKSDASVAHTYIVKFISGNPTAEAKLLPHKSERNGRLDFKALIEHYEGVGIHAKNVTEADKTIDSLFYNGERKPHMWWEEFEKRLSTAFVIFDKKENRQVYSDEMRLRILCRKVTADFLQNTRTFIEIELSKLPVTMTYNQALANFRNEVNRKFPPNMAQANRNTRRVSETNGRGRGRGRGRGNGGGRTQGRGRGRGGGGRGHPEARWVTGTDGKSYEVHPSYKFNDNVWQALPYNEKQAILDQRKQYVEDRKRSVSEISVDNRSNNNNSSNSQKIPEQISESFHISQITTGQGSIMGGRNEQASLKSRGGRNS